MEQHAREGHYFALLAFFSLIREELDRVGGWADGMIHHLINYTDYFPQGSYTSGPL